MPRHYPTSAASAAASVTAVVGTGDQPGEQGRQMLTVQLTVDPSQERRVDTTQMARDLRSALEQLAAA